MRQLPAFLFLHGFPLNGSMWSGQAAAFRDRYRVLTPDLAGFGATPRREGDAGMSLAEQAGHVLELAAGAGVEEFVLCGLSMGGYVAFEVWRQAPSRVRALVLTNTRAAADTPETAAVRLAQAAAVRQWGTAVIVDAYLPKLCGAATYANAPHIVARLRVMMERTPAAGIIAGLDALRTRRDHTGILRGIACPALVVMADGDVISPPAEMEAMAAAIPAAHTACIAGAGHLAPLEQPDAWNAAITAFLADVNLA